MGSGYCTICDKTIPEHAEHDQCACCGRAICMPCIDAGAAYVDQVSGLAYCTKCVIELEPPDRLERGDYDHARYYYEQELDLDAAGYCYSDAGPGL